MHGGRTSVDCGLIFYAKALCTAFIISTELYSPWRVMSIGFCSPDGLLPKIGAIIISPAAVAAKRMVPGGRDACY